MLTGCLNARSDPPSSSESDELPTSWNFSLRNATFNASASLIRKDPGTAVGPDLESHPADLYELTERIELRSGDVAIKWTLATEPATWQVLSSLTSCFVLDATKEALSCTPDVRLLIPTSSEAIFFGAPLVLPYAPTFDGPFSVAVWDAGTERSIPFHRRSAGSRVEIQTDFVLVEHFYVEKTGSSSASSRDCDVFEGDTLLVENGALGCREAEKGWEWWVDRPPAFLASNTSRDYVPPIGAVWVEHSTPPETAILKFPIEEAMETIRKDVPQAREQMERDNWRLAKFWYGWVSSTGTGPLECWDYLWKLDLVAEKQPSVAASASRKICAGQTVPPDSAILGDWEPTRKIPYATTSVLIQHAINLTLDRIFCATDPPGGVSLTSTTKEYDDSNRSWLVIGAGPKGSATFDQASGFLIDIRSSSDPLGAVPLLFSNGQARPCP